MMELNIVRDVSLSVVVFRLEDEFAETGAWDAVATAAVWNPSPDVGGLLSPEQRVLAGAHLETVSGRVRARTRAAAVTLAIAKTCAELERLGLERTSCSHERAYVPGRKHPEQMIGLHPGSRDISLMVTAFRLEGGQRLGLSDPAWQSIAVVADWNPGIHWASGPIQEARQGLRTPTFHGRAKSPVREDALVQAADMALEQLEASGLHT